MNTIKNKKGFTIVELMIALALTGIILAAVYGVYTAFYKTSGSQDLLIEAQQNAKAGIAVIERDLINAGLNAGTADVITEATTSSIEFIYRDPRATDSKPKKKVRYVLWNASNQPVTTGTCNAEPCVLKKKIGEWNTGTSSWDGTGGHQEVIPNVYALAFTYYDANGRQIAYTSIDEDTAAEQTNRNTIRLVKVSLTTKTSSVLPTKGDYSTVTLTTQVHLRNMGAAGTAGDTTAPEAPSILAVRDPHVCGKLDIKWQKSTATDVAGYKIFYGQTSGSYTAVVSVSGCPGESGTTCTYTLQPTGANALVPQKSSEVTTYPISADDTTNKYFIAMQAYDNSGNSSVYSAERSGNTADGNPTLADGAYDTTINPVKPAAPATFTAADGSQDGWVSLTWPASTATDVVGYRIYRDTAAFSSWPISAAKQIAGETGFAADKTLSSSATSWTDKDTTLVGCQTYYYAIAAVNCDTTLVTDTDANEDGNNTKYISTDYTNAAGDTAPPDTHFYNNDGGNPTTPTLSVRAGWQRVNVTLTNPTRTTATGNVNNVKDFKQTCVYVNAGASYPTLDAVLAGNGCFSATTGQLVPDSSGIFTQSASVPAFWHDSMLVEEPGAPSLANLQTYSYKAVSLDYCGNTSTATAQDQTNLCGEDPAGKPDVTPVNPLNPSASSCSGSITVTWTAISSNAASPSSATNPWDLAGYRIARSTDGGAYEIISGAAPIWCAGACTYTDAGVTDGHTYQYKIAPTDCPYEKVNPSSATILADIASGTLKSESTGVIKPGKIDRDEKTSAVQDSHMEILTGKVADIYSGYAPAIDTSLPYPNYPNESYAYYDYYHNTVVMYFENTNAGTMTITKLNTLEWNNTEACLKRITIGGSPSSAGTPQTVVYNPDPLDLAKIKCASPTGAIDFDDKQILALDRHVPIIFEFSKSDGTVDSSTDMRGKNVRVDLKVTNDSTGTASCSTYLTYSGSNEASFVPRGPEVANVTQDKPSSTTSPYTATSSNNPDPLSNPSVISVGGGNNVNVTITVNSTTTDHTGNPIAIDSAAVGSESTNVKLYWTTTAQNVYQAPQYSGANYTAINMFKTAANTYGLHRTGAYDCGVTPTATHADDRRIPAQASAKRIWYFIVVKDTEGNFDRAPEVSNNSSYYTAYTYDQGAFDACQVTPAAPTNLTAAAVTDDITLSWTASTTYSDGGCKSASDSFNYRIYRGGAQIGADQPGLTYIDNNLANGIYSYYVKAKNSCGTEERLSSASNTAVKCIGAAGSTLTVSPTSIYPNDSFTVTVTNCSQAGGGIGSISLRINAPRESDGGDTFTVSEDAGDTGTFVQVAPTSSTTNTTTTLYVYASGDTLTVDPLDPVSEHGGPVTVTVNANPCDTTPNPATGLNLFIDGVNDAARGNSTNIHVRFTAPQANTDASNLSDLANYKLNVTKDGAAFAAVNIPLSSCTSSLADPPAGTTCDYLYEAGGKMREFVWSFTLKAVDNCSTGGKESSATGPLQENCTATNNCAATY